MNKRVVFDELYRRYYPKLVIHASLFLSGEEAHDVVQEVFLHLLEKAKVEPDGESLNAYLYKAVQNKCIDIIRHQSVKEQYSSHVGRQLLQKESEYYYATRNEIEEAIENRELQDQLAAAIERLPTKGKEVFKLYFEEQKTAKEIGLILNISVSTVNNHIYTCMKTLRERLSGRLLSVFFFVFF